MRPQRSSTGSGFVIRDSSGKLRVITNAHVVNHSTTVHIRRPGNPKKVRVLVLALELAVRVSSAARPRQHSALADNPAAEPVPQHGAVRGLHL